MVTSSENPKYHSKCLSTFPANLSILSKSIIKYSVAIETVKILKPIPIGLFEKRCGIVILKSPKMICVRYIKKIASAQLKITILNLSVHFNKPV